MADWYYPLMVYAVGILTGAVIVPCIQDVREWRLRRRWSKLNDVLENK
jgi:uncharacterized integral membrane protein